VDYIHSNLKKPCFWIPVEAAGGPLESFSFYWIFLSQDYIGFDIVTPQPHYLQCQDISGDGIRPIGMTYHDLVTFIKMSSKLGMGVEYESNSGVEGKESDCGCGSITGCIRRAANYWCAYQAAGVTSPVSYYSDVSIKYEQDVQQFLSINIILYTMRIVIVHYTQMIIFNCMTG